MLTILEHFVTHSLLYTGDCKLLGVGEVGQVFAEELYGDDDWLAQHEISPIDGIITTVDEATGDNPDVQLLDLPKNLIEPIRRSCCKQLVFSGARLRGIQAEERIDELVLSLSIEEKIELVEFMDWEVDPLQIIGIAESVVLSHTQVKENLLIVCRRLRIAYRLQEIVKDSGLSYDYDSLEVYILHEFIPSDADNPNLLDCLNDIDDVVLLRPMDCLYHDGRLYVADGGEDEDVSAIHIFDLIKILEAE